MMMLFTGDKVIEKVTSAQKSFAELMCPLMLQLLLSYDNPQVNDKLIAGINFFFNESAEKLDFPTANKESVFLDKLAIRLMLKLVECIRIHCLEYRRSNMARKFHLNFLIVAKSAKHCKAFFTAVLYCELWAEKEKTARFNKTLQKIMHTSMTSIGIHDASDFFVDPMNRSLFLQISGQNWQNILEHDATGSDGYLELLMDVGLNSLVHKLLTGKKPYEYLWRLCDWNALIENVPEVNQNEEFEKCHYASLKLAMSWD